MKPNFLLLCVVLSLSSLIGCIGITQTLETPASLPLQPTVVATSSLPIPTANSATATETVVSAPPTQTPKVLPFPTQTLLRAPTKEVPPPIDTVPTPQGGTMIPDPTLVKLIAEAKVDLSLRAKVPPDEIQLVSAQAVEWRDSSLGCPMPGMMYAQVITPGYLIVLEAAGKEWNYHASTTQVMWCDK